MKISRRPIYVLVEVLLLTSASGARAQDTLERAYQQEIQLIRIEKQQLLSQIKGFEARNQEEIGALRTEVVTLTETLTSLQLENDALQESIGAMEERVQVSSDRQTLIDNTLSQAIATLNRNGIALQQQQEDLVVAVGEVFEKGCALVERIGRLRIENGTYFAADGSERNAEILWLSQVAALSLDPKNGGALAPVGSGSLKVLNADSLSKALELYKGNKPSLVGMYIFDPLERGKQAARADRTLVETFLAGGFVMWPILVLAVIALLIVLERFAVLSRVHTNADRLMNTVRERISLGHWNRAAEACKKNPGALARVLSTILRNREQPRSNLEELTNESILAERPTLERFLPALNVIAVVAPLLGLLGTVTGMIGTFHVITEHGTGNPGLLSAGISEALLTTQFGLMVAIPTLLAHALLSARVDHVLSNMEINALKLLNEMHCEHCERLKNGTCRGAINGEQECPFLGHRNKKGDVSETASGPPAQAPISDSLEGCRV
ncbi:MAG: MotA/TolQ/ExbB proton channel family protein [Deltaproteobacteria bacterium]|nr:MotA/TolQ/ExbB proton channel family protein [Deltaproteobacteria bacterium]